MNRVNFIDGITVIPASFLNELQDAVEKGEKALPRTGGEMENEGAAKGLITFPGINSAFRTGRDNAAIKVKYPNEGSSNNYVPLFSGKGKNCSWEGAVYGDSFYFTRFADSDYDSDENTPSKTYILSDDGISNLQGWKLVASGSLSADGKLSGTVDNTLYKTIHILIGSSISGQNHYQSFDCSLALTNDYWYIYIPAAGDYYRALVETTEAGVVTVTMLSSITRMFYVYASL